MAELRFPLPLDRPPVIDQIGVGSHGQRREERWCLPRQWCLHAYTYHADLDLDGHPLAIRPGRVGVCPPGARLRYRYRGPSVHTYVHFRAFPGPATPVPAMADLGRGAGAFADDLLAAVGWWATAPRRAEARLWDLLWRLASAHPRDEDPRHPALAAAQELIERGLHGVLAVPDVARAAGCSHTHLTRLFRRHLGTDVVGYIRRRRASRAAHLLRHSDRPAAEVADAVGVGDVQRLNKLVRRELGRPPRELRRGT